ncbi:MAG: serine hydrolase domain-containing protein [Gemmatimonadota bacterium]
MKIPMRARLSGLTLLLQLIAVTSVSAQGVESYDAWFQSVTKALVASTRAPTISVAVMSGDHVIYADAGGSIAPPARHGPSPATMYRVGSISKLFTASIAARLASRGVVNLDADVRQYVPEFPAKRGTVTLRELAGHQSGIRHYGLGEFISRTHYDSLAPTVKIFLNDPLLFEPGTKYSYSSYGFNLLALALERAAHKPFLRLLRDEVTGPLKLKHTEPDMVGRVIADRAQLYAFDSLGTPISAVPDDLSDRWPSGGMLSSVIDLARFGMAFTGGRFIPDSMVRVMTTPQHLQSGAATIVGLAWRVGTDSAGRTIWHHAGTSNGGRALLVVWPAEHLVVALAANAMVPFDLPAAFKYADIARSQRPYR